MVLMCCTRVMQQTSTSALDFLPDPTGNIQLVSVPKWPQKYDRCQKPTMAHQGQNPGRAQPTQLEHTRSTGGIAVGRGKGALHPRYHPTEGKRHGPFLQKTQSRRKGRAGPHQLPLVSRWPLAFKRKEKSTVVLYHHSLMFES